MQVISKNKNYVISSSFGTSIVEGTNAVGASGKTISFQLDQINPIYKSFYWKIEPITGSYGDFWDNFWSNRVGGEPADEFALSGGGSSVELIINPDNYSESNEQFKISFYLSVLDPYHGTPPVASATFTIIDDDGIVLKGGKGADTLIGTRKVDTLYGNAGNDTLDGKGGADFLYGGAGNDTFLVDNALDQVFEAAGQGSDTILSSVSYHLAAKQQVETLKLLPATGKAKLNLSGNEFANTLVGNDGANVLDGKGGADRMSGGLGNDTYLVDNSRDAIVESARGGVDKVLTTVSYALKAGQEIESLQLLSSTGTARLNLAGNEFGQTIVGNAGTNGLEGKGGHDVLTGGRGADTFVFASALGANNVDRITDFAAEDTIRLGKSIFSALAPGQLAESAFKNISTDKVDAADRILYKQATGELFYDADGSGKAAAVKFAVLDNKVAITHADFLIG